MTGQKDIKCMGALVPYFNSSEIKFDLIKYILSFPYAYIFTNNTNHLLIGIIYIHKDYSAKLVSELRGIARELPEIRLELSEFMEPKSIRFSLNNPRS